MQKQWLLEIENWFSVWFAWSLGNRCNHGRLLEVSVQLVMTRGRYSITQNAINRICVDCKTVNSAWRQILRTRVKVKTSLCVTLRSDLPESAWQINDQSPGCSRVLMQKGPELAWSHSTVHVHQNHHKTVSLSVNTSQQDWLPLHLGSPEHAVSFTCSISTGRQMARASRKASELRCSLSLSLSYCLSLSLCKVMLQQIMFVHPAPSALMLERDLPAAGGLNTLGIIKR